MFTFSHKKFDFLKVYESIKHFYPIGVKKDEGGLYYSYPGIKELDAIVFDNVHHVNHFEERWTIFTKKISQKVGKEIIGTTYGNAPSFSSYVLLNKMTVDNLTRTKELHFFVSLIGPYYSIIGKDTNLVNLDDRLFRSTNYLVVSPEGEFANIFEVIGEMIEHHFTGFRFIPFSILIQTIEGLNVRYSDENLNTVCNAVFNNLIDLNWSKTIGNIFHKSEDWIKEDYVEDGGGWKAYPPKD